MGVGGHSAYSIGTWTCWNGRLWIKHACSFCFALPLWWDPSLLWWLCICKRVQNCVCLCLCSCACVWDAVCPNLGCPISVRAICPGSLLSCFNIKHLLPIPAVTCWRHTAVSFTHSTLTSTSFLLHTLAFTSFVSPQLPLPCVSVWSFLFPFFFFSPAVNITTLLVFFSSCVFPFLHS